MASATYALCVDYLRIRKFLRLDEPFGVGFAPRHCESRRGVAIAMTAPLTSLREAAGDEATHTKLNCTTHGLSPSNKPLNRVYAPE